MNLPSQRFAEPPDTFNFEAEDPRGYAFVADELIAAKRAELADDVMLIGLICDTVDWTTGRHEKTQRIIQAWRNADDETLGDLLRTLVDDELKTGVHDTLKTWTREQAADYFRRRYLKVA